MMPDSAHDSQPSTTSVAQLIRTLRTITLVLVMAICAFGVFAMSRAGHENAPNAAPPDGEPAARQAAPQLGMLSFLAVGMLVICGTLSATVPRVIVNAQLKTLANVVRNEKSQPVGARPETFLAALLRIYQTQFIVRATLVEAPAMLALVAYMIEGHAAALVVPAVSIAILLTSLPSVRKVAEWIEQRMAEYATG